jgi:hypothetical protein
MMTRPGWLRRAVWPSVGIIFLKWTRTICLPQGIHCTALHCTALHCTALHCTALFVSHKGYTHILLLLLLPPLVHSIVPASPVPACAHFKGCICSAGRGTASLHHCITASTSWTVYSRDLRHRLAFTGITSNVGQRVEILQFSSTLQSLVLVGRGLQERLHHHPFTGWRENGFLQL